jgi:hypothetical protein
VRLRALKSVESSTPTAVVPARRRRRASRPRISDLDREVLAFAAEHRFIICAHVQALLRCSESAAQARLSRLCGGGFLLGEKILHKQPGTYRSTRKGLSAAQSKLRAPNIDLGRYDHEIGAAWLWLAARNGAFGTMREVLAERSLRSRDATPDERSGPLAVRLGGNGRGGRARLHYPDLLLVDPSGRRIAIELELSSKGRTRREQILTGYASDVRFAAVVYVVEEQLLGRSIEASARQLGISGLVHVRQVRWGTSASRAGRALLRSRELGATAVPAGAGDRVSASGRAPAPERRANGDARLSISDRAIVL